MNQQLAINSIHVSIALFAWNEESGVAQAIESLFQQSLFGEVGQRFQSAEIICVCNGCTDRTPVVAAETLDRLCRTHPGASSVVPRVIDLPQRGKLNAWNQFVHHHSAKEARFLFMMDTDILLCQRQTLWNMLRVLEKDPQTYVSVDHPRKNLLYKKHRSLRERASLAASQVTLAADAQLCAQLYCIRSAIARNIYLPRDLPACEDGFIKSLVCTDFLTREIQLHRIRVAPEAEHIFEAYTSPWAILRNQKRQIIGQTIVHLLVDKTLKSLPRHQRERMAETLKTRETANPDWLKHLIARHLKQITFFWQLYPGLLGHSLRRLNKLGLCERLACLPSALARCATELLASFLAYRSLKAGCTDYWPKAARTGLKTADLQSPIDLNVPPAQLGQAGGVK